MLVGRQEPRVLTVPSSAVESWVDDALALWSLTGRSLDPWQETVCDALMSVDVDDMWAATEFGLLVSRQQGKGEILQVYDLAHLYLWARPDGEPKTILHTAHEYATVEAHYRKLKRQVRATPWMRRQLKGGGKETSRGVSGISTGMGRLVFELENGNRLVLQTRTGNAGVGLTVDTLIVDEAQQSPAETMEALLYTQDGVPNPQTLYAGTAPVEHQDGEHFESVRDRGRSGGGPRTGWAEFSPDGSDDPDTAAAIDYSSHDVWVQGCPALGIRTSLETIEDRWLALKDTNLASFVAQRLSIWPDSRPEVDQILNDVDLGVWREKGSGMRVGVGAVLAVALGRGGGYSTIGGAWRSPEGGIVVEHLATAEGALWVVDRLVELRGKYRSPMVVLDERNAAPILSDLERAGLRPWKLSTLEVGGAFELFVESVNAGLVEHAGQEELTISLRHAKPRAMGRGLSTWDQGVESEPVTLVQAVTFAVWGLKRHEGRGGSRSVPLTPGVLSVDLSDSGDSLYSVGSGSGSSLSWLG